MRFPAAIVGCSANTLHPPSGHHRENPTQQVSVEAPRDVTVTGRSPPILPNRRPKYLSARRACRVHRTSRCTCLRWDHLRDLERSLRRPQPCREFPSRLSGSGVEARCRRRVATPAASQHARSVSDGSIETSHGRSQPKLASSACRSLSVASVTNHRFHPKLCKRRLDTAELPHGV